ncbi:phosphotransferase [Georgenia alba]|uniref:Phosphotransferase n=1 Tax=Georgenia alba TaxID=2233858 RepID=A0ABW2Q8G0_9MICO
MTDVDEGFAAQLAEATALGLVPEPDAVRAIWADAVAAPAWTGPPVWIHGDLHPANVLTEDGTLCGVIDFGTSAPATLPGTSRPPGSCFLTASSTASTTPTAQERTRRPCAALAAALSAGPSPVS